jgi:enterochelin esterase-like enzyme
LKFGWIFLLLLMAVLASSACTASGAAQDSPPTITGVVPPTRPASPSAPVLTVSATPSPAPTFSPSPSPSPAPSPTPTPLACWQKGGRIVKGSLRTDLLPLPLEYRVYLPPCYAQQPDRYYPVLYLIHGQNYNDDQWDRLEVDETANTLIAAGEIPPLIIVMPRDRSWAQPTEDRFGQVLADSLVPAIDESYRTIPDRSHRAVGGLSRGAGWAVHLALSRWELFSALGAHSLPVFWADTPHVRQWLKDIPADSLPRIYLDIGEKDRPSIMNSAVWFEELLTELDIPHEWHLFTGYHEEAYWQSHVEQYLRWYTQDW